MNKKILIAAIGAVMVAGPVIAQADAKYSGRILRELTSVSGNPGGVGDGLMGGDNGHSRLQFDGSSDMGFVRMAWDIRANTFKQREQYAGLKLGNGKLSFGRLGNAYAGALNIDPLKATFMEIRKKSVSKVNSFNSGMLGYAMKMGDMSVNVQYGPAYVDQLGTPNNPYDVGFKGKFGGVTVGAAIESDSAGNSSTGVVAKMKFGDIGVGISAESVDGAYIGGGAAGTTSTSYTVLVGMKMGGMNIDLAAGQNSTDSRTLMRVGLTKKFDKKARLYAGFISYNDITMIGGGLRVDL